jgi:hypothetical protein
MKEIPETPKEWLLFALKEYQISLLADNGDNVRIENGYEVEIEQNGVFKLKHEGKVVAPFRDLDELCGFVKMG